MAIKQWISGFAAAAVLGFGGAAQAVQVECGNNLLGVRLTAIDPGLVGGFCYAQNGNFIGDNFNTPDIVAAYGANTLTMRGKEIASNGDVASSLLDFSGSRSGTWTVANSLWTAYNRVFLAFHFGGGGNTSADNPDSFIVELARPDLTGRWELTGAGAQLTDLSNIYVLSDGVCTANCGGGVITVPEPGALTLVGLALMAGGLLTRRKA